MIFADCALKSVINDINEPSEGAELNPPVWPETVHIIKSEMSDDDAQAKLNDLQEKTRPVTEGMLKEDPSDAQKQLIGTEVFTPTEHFSNERKVIFFEPREEPYRVQVQVGYYVQVAGLGAAAEDVQFADAIDGKVKKGPYCPAYFNEKLKDLTILDTFWRSAENFKNTSKDGQQWAVSQAAPIRRVHATHDFHLDDGAAQASGGHLANVQVDGTLVFGAQQQFCAKSVTAGGDINLGAWSNVFVDTVATEGCLKTPSGWLASGGQKFDKNLSLETRNKNYRVRWDAFPTTDKEGPSTTVNVPKATVEK